MILKKNKPTVYYIAVMMPNIGRGAYKLRFYRASRDLRLMLDLEKKLFAFSWKQKFLEALLVVPKKKYHYPLHLDDNEVMASLAKVVGVTEHRPKFTIATTKAQFVLVETWTADRDSDNHLVFLQHDYPSGTKKKI
ncbi:DUF7679 family protein [Leuconostoc citreum]|uniref:DUF7679 family protein n=1 Tax=Leuconostoc citreum TaxID=33964 RepID=UPI0032DE606F